MPSFLFKSICFAYFPLLLSMKLVLHKKMLAKTKEGVDVINHHLPTWENL